MYLKQLEIIGFKSFANKTVVKFASGVTAIVGPNGCGKTNILDALRWVLGEQRPTLLRGGKMEEVIFNGTRDLKPLGMSEVSLTVVNDRGVLPTEYNEVQITRRLFRSGESEYLLNKVPCRLKDITELFVDTGMGAHSYSVIQQDMIDSVISDKAEERRFLFEEAAGITKYKHRRKAAQRKLEATENDFLRLRDIYNEVKTRVTSLYRQHKKAERYQSLLDEIRGWDLYLMASRFTALEYEKRTLRAEFDNLADQKLGKETALEQAGAQMESERIRLVDVERSLTEVGGQLYQIAEKAHAIEREISVLREKKANAAIIIQKNGADIEAIAQRLVALGEQLAETERELIEQENALENIAAAVQAADTDHVEADKLLFMARSSNEDKNRQLIELEGKLSSGKTEEQNLREQDEELTRQITEIENRLSDDGRRAQEVMAQRNQHQTGIDELAERKRQFEQQQVSLTDEMERLVEQGESLSLDMTSATASIEAAVARRNLLADMMLHYEGYDHGVVAAMELREQWPTIGGTVADRFVPVEGMEVALEAALGDMAKFLICFDRTTAEQIIAHLKSEKKGKIGILVPDTGAIAPAVKRPELNLPGVIGWMDSFVSTDEGLRPLMEAVLARTVVFDAATHPGAILERLPYGFSAVSTDGVVYSSNVIAGGQDERFPLFRRKERVEEQDSIISELTGKLESLKNDKNHVTARVAAIRAESIAITGQMETIAEAAEVEQKKLSETEYLLRTIANDSERLNREKGTAAGKREKIRNRQYSLELDFSQLASQKEAITSTMTVEGNRLGDFERAASEAMERLSKLQVQHIEARSKAEQTQSRISHVNELRRDLETTRSTKQAEIEQAQRDTATADESVASLEGDLKLCAEARETETVRQNELRVVQSELTTTLSEAEKAAKTLRAEREAIADQMHKAEIRLNTMQSEITTIAEKTQEEYSTEIGAVEAAKPNAEMADDQARQHLHEIKEKIKGFGAVNLLALEEYREAAEREKFLGEQLKDLTTAKNDLQSTILKINETAKTLFAGTMDQVRQNFQRLFVELFSGGEADIRLEDPDDPLESNIEIIARPRGKRLLNITMMSGGERALTAISLLFALYLVKPSPFCILDEIDAPLDDANCKRFLRIIRTFANQTQFITITHNKITMEAADNLYGVTMEQPGVSKLVGVKFADEGAGSADRAIMHIEDDVVDEVPIEEEELPAAIQERITSVSLPDEREP